jgi:ATP-dependent Lhr-like helicase
MRGRRSAPVEDPEARLTAGARRLLAALRARGASFFGDLRGAAGLDDEAARSAVGSLVAAGMAASDGFAGVRALVRSAYGRPATLDRRAQFAGRWTAIATGPAEEGRPAAVEAQAWTLSPPLRRGVPASRWRARRSLRPGAIWRASTGAWKRAERSGGRFVSGMSGEQFALPGAVERLRCGACRRTAVLGTIGTADPAQPRRHHQWPASGSRRGPQSAVWTACPWRCGRDLVRALALIDPAIAADVSRASAGGPVRSR